MTESSPARRLAAIVAADVVGYSRLMGIDEADTHARLKTLREVVIEPHIAACHGRIVKLMGDGILAEFPSMVNALASSVEVQRAVALHNVDIAEDRRIVFRIGVNLGDIIVEGDDIYGDGVNIAARLEGLAEPGGICISQMARDSVGNKLPLEYEDMGEQRVKNIAEPVRAYQVRVPADMVMPQGSGAPDKPVTRDNKRYGLWAIAVVVIVLLTGGGAWYLSPKATSPPQTSAGTESLDKQRIAVLPFVNVSADPEQEYFADGMTEELISKLSKLHKLAVIARTSVMSYKGSNKKVDEIGRELRVGTLLEGSVRKAQNRLRITVQLIDTASQEHLWSQDYDRHLKDVFEVQSDVAQNIAEALEVTLGTGEKRQLEEQATQNLEAYNLYLQGLYLFHKSSDEGLNNSIAYFERALQYDPSYAQAHAGIALAYGELGYNSLLPPKDAFEKAKSAAEKALELNNTIVDAHLTLAGMSQILDYDQARAEQAYRRALEIAPNSAVANSYYGIQYLSPMGRHEEAIKYMKRAIELDPASPLFLMILGWGYYMAQQYDLAIEWLQRSIDMEPNTVDGYRGLGEVYVQKGMYNEAIAALRKFVEFTDSHDYALGYLGYAYGMAGQRDKALEMLKALEDRAKKQYVVPTALAPIYMGLGDKNKALDELWRAYEERSMSHLLLYLKVFPVYNPLHSEPRFQELLKKIGVAS